MKKKKDTEAVSFLTAVEEVAKSSNLQIDDVMTALHEGLKKAFIKFLGGQDDAQIAIDINREDGEINMYYIQTVVEEVMDDFLEIELAEAKKIDKKLVVGDQLKTPYHISDLDKNAVKTLINVFKQKLAELEKAALYEQYKDKIGEMVTGIVEATDERGTSVRIGNNYFYLKAKDCIGNETFEVGKTIKVFVVNVESTTKGAQISISRSHEGFLRRLMEEEIVEVYDGTVIIRSIARQAGNRAKVAVYSTDHDVDATGACIGPNGTRIQKVVAQLGNGVPAEKIDVIPYNEYAPLYVMEALRPAIVIGINYDFATRTAIVVVQNGNLSVAIGKKGVNAKLAVQLTSWNIDIKELDDALREGLRFYTAEDIKRELEDERQRLEEEKALAAIVPTVKDEIPEDFVLEDKSVAEVATEIAVAEEAAVEEVKPVEVKKEEVKPVAPKIQTVRTTKTLDELEAELEMEKQKAKGQTQRRKYKKQEEKVEEDTTSKLPAAPRMEIYTAEEIEQFEREEDLHNDYDDKYSEYDELYDEDYH